MKNSLFVSGVAFCMATTVSSVFAALPAGYEQVTGISSTASGHQQILTDYVPSSCNVTIEAKVVLTGYSTQGIWCSRAGANDRTMTLFCWAADNYFRTDRNTSSGVYAKKRAELGKASVLKGDYKERKFYVDGVASSYSMGSGDFTPVSKLGFFGSHANGGSWGYWANMSILYAKVWNADGTLECDFVPVRKVSAVGTKDEYGLYDLIADKYYTSGSSVGFNEYVVSTATFTEETDAQGHDLLVMTVSRGLYEMTDADRATINASTRTLVKRGVGEVVPGSIEGFMGDLVLEDGVWQVSATNSLGASNVGTVTIKSGATLKINSKTGGTVRGKTIYLEGNGYDNQGVIVALATAWNSIVNSSLILTGDAYINQGARLDYYDFIDTCGHNLRFKGSSSSGIGGNWYTNSTDTASTVLVDGNQIILAQKDGHHYFGSSDNRLSLTNEANYSINWDVTHGWTLDFQNGSKIIPQKLTANTVAKPAFSGPGPVLFSGTVKIGSGSAKSKGTTNETMTLSAPLRGSGKLVVDPGWLNIKSTDNTYAGTIVVTGRSDVARAGIRVYDGAVYSAAETQLANADFEYQSAQGLDLGPMTFSGAQSSISGPCTLEKAAATTVSRLTKTGAGTLSLAGNMAIAEADVQGGTVRLPNRYYGHAGLMEGTYVDMSASSQAIWCSRNDDIETKIGDGNWTYSSQGAKKILNGYDSFVDTKTHATAVCYRGYLWNRNETNETWTFALHMTFRMIMRLNGDWTPWSNSGENGTNLWTTTVKPGANPILVYSLSGNWLASQKPSKRFDGLGLSYYRGEVDAEHLDEVVGEFAKLDDGGTGFLLTVDDEGTTSGSDLLPQIAQATFGSGTTFDLGRNDFTIGDVTGCPSVANASLFTLSGCWSLSAANVEANEALTVAGALAFGGDAVLDLGYDPLLCSDAVTARLAQGMVVARADEILGQPYLSTALQAAGATMSVAGGQLTLTVPAAKSVKVENGEVKVAVSVPAVPPTEVTVRIFRDGQVVAEELLGPGRRKFAMNWSSATPGFYAVATERVAESGTKDRGTIGSVLLASPDVAVRYVSTTGSDAADGTTPATAMATVQAAVDDLGTAGGTVYVMPGTYVLNVPFNGVVVSNPVSVVGWTVDPSEVVLKRNASASPNMRVFQLNHADAALRMVTLSGGYTWTGGTISWPDKDGSNDMAGGANLYIAAAGGTAENCILKSGVTAGYTHAGGNAYLKAGRLVNCELVAGGMKDLANDQWRDAGASLSARGGTIENCWIHGVAPGTGGGTNTYVVCLYGTARMVGCTVTDNVGYFCGGITIGDAAVKVYDTAIYNNTATYEDAPEHADLYLRSSRNANNVSDPALAFVTCAAARAINADCLEAATPGFTDAANGDYTLKASSPLIDAGSSAAVSGRESAYDLKGRARVSRNGVDIGCYEFRAPKFKSLGMSLFVR